MELLGGSIVVIAALGFVCYPLIRWREPGAGGQVDAEDGLAARRRAIYQEMIDLDLDHRVGKLDDADYQQLYQTCLARAAALLAQADAQATQAEERVEREVAAMREALRATGRATVAGRRSR
ncbi:MAG TPA: hypothetical protein VEQ11_02075 [Chloroflexota bacterium]|nr:hypothetical protein [Chloroflexota bacterium]